MNKERDICDNCKCFHPVHNDSAEKNGYCAFTEIPVNKTDAICKKFERSHMEERIVTSGDFYKNRAFVFANIKKQKEIEKRDLIIKLVEVFLIALLVGVTIYFGFN